MVFAHDLVMVADVAGLTASDVASVAGTLVAALIGIGGLVGVLWLERRSRYRERLDDALVAVLMALGERSIALADHDRSLTWRGHPRKPEQYPLDTELHTTVEAAWLVARGRDLEVVGAIANTTYAMKTAGIAWQVAKAGEVAADIRRWRTKELSGQGLISKLKVYDEASHASYTAIVAAGGEDR